MTSLRQMAGALTAEITMLSGVIADLLAADRSYQVIRQLPGIGPVLGAGRLPGGASAPAA